MPARTRELDRGALRAALGQGNLEQAADALFQLDRESQASLEERLGAHAFAQVYRQARKRRARTVDGRVIVVHGNWGAELEPVWLDPVQLARGGFAKLRLGSDGESTAGSEVRLGAIVEDYLPLLLALRERWEVTPFAFDWRRDIDESADRLADRVREWAEGEPVHIVAHSMGGLVARSFAARHHRLWGSMRDPDRLRRGGRLVLLGAPQRGSFAAVLALSGQELVTKALSSLSAGKPGDPSVREVLCSFPGCYQLLPSPLGRASDDRKKLFEAAAWGATPIRPELLEKASRFHAALHDVFDPERLLQVAGYDQRTPVGLRILSPGKFEYRMSHEGDGRVSHELGVLDGVATSWVRECHSALPTSRAVLDGIHELLATGSSSALEGERGATRPLSSDEEWVAADAVDELSVEDRGGAVLSALTRGWVGAPAALARSASVRRSPARPRLAVQVRWSDIQNVVDAQVFMCGHYANVVPQAAERALDQVISAEDSTPEGPRTARVIHGLTQQGMIRGAVGDVHFFPWAQWAVRKHGLPPKANPLVGIACMGFMGTFGLGELRRLARTVVFALERLPDVTHVATVLIGAGNGNIPPASALETYLRGFLDGLADGPSPRELTLTFAERYVTRALRMHGALHEIQQRMTDDSQPSPFTIGDLELLSGGRRARKTMALGAVGDEDAIMLSLLQVLRVVRGSEPGDQELDAGFFPRIESVLRAPGIGAKVRETLKAEFLDPADPSRPLDLREADLALLKTLDKLEVRRGRRVPTRDFPTRVSVVRERGTTPGSGDAALTAIAALTDTAVVPKRYSALDWGLVREAAEKLRDPDPASIPKLARTLGRLVLPRDFREFIEGSAPLVVEVDRATAVIPWELMIAIGHVEDTMSRSVGLLRRVARQLRTEYSPPPTPAPPQRERLKALVIGDPGDPERGESLPGARREARAMHKLLESLGVEVQTMIGAASPERAAEDRSTRPATRLDVLAELLDGGYDILHYAGHGSFDPQDPTRSGWLFADGLLTSFELAQVDVAPQLVFANACVSGLVSSRTSSGERTADGRRDFDLLPALADEFFRRGVRNYIGTAWEINDAGAVRFAETFYRALLAPEPDTARDGSIGDALLVARQDLAEDSVRFGALWAAYHHYGDPTACLSRPAPGVPDPPATGRRRRAPKRPVR